MMQVVVNLNKIEKTAKKKKKRVVKGNLFFKITGYFTIAASVN